MTTSAAARQARYRQRMMALAVKGRTGARGRPLQALLGDLPPEVGDEAKRALAALVEHMKPQLQVVTRLLWLDGAQDAARELGAVLDIDPDPTRGATYGQLHQALAEAGMDRQQVAGVFGEEMARLVTASIADVERLGDATIGLSTAYRIEPMLRHLGMWPAGSPDAVTSDAA